MALSTASAPVFMRRAISKPVSSVRSLEKGPSEEVWKAREERVSF